jgi:hypothetical protein
MFEYVDGMPVKESDCRSQEFDEQISRAGIVYRAFYVNALGRYIQGHTHEFGHDMLISQGEADVELWTRDSDHRGTVHLKAGDIFYVDKDIFHKIIPTVAPYRHTCIFTEAARANAIAEPLPDRLQLK